MATKAINQLDDKEHFTDLTTKQRVVVNALAEYPDKGPKEISEIASKALDGDTVSRSYVTPIKQKYGDLVEKQREIKENERYEGEETTEGDPFKSLDETLADNSNGYQTIQERPHTGSEQSDEDTEELEERTIEIDVTRRDVEQLLAGTVPEEIRRMLIVRVVDRAFE